MWNKYVAFFIIFTIIPLAEFYKCYINSYCMEAKFEIRKLISTRYDLNKNQQYDLMIPSIDFPNYQYVFEQAKYAYLNNQISPQKPTQEELNRATQYQDKIPNYKCVSYKSLNNGQIKVGVVQNDKDETTQLINQNEGQNSEMRNNMNMNMNMNMGTINTKTNMNPANARINMNNGYLNENSNDILVINSGSNQQF